MTELPPLPEVEKTPKLPLPPAEMNDLLPLPPGEGGGFTLRLQERLSAPGQREEGRAPTDLRSARQGQRRAATPIVLDTNIILDVFVFNDPAAEPVRQALAQKDIDWLATQPMRDELARVLAYPKIAVKLAFYKLTATDVLAKFDQHARITPAAPKASVTCKDADDQKFIDLAVQHRALLLSKDQHVTSMKKRLLAHGILAQAAM